MYWPLYVCGKWKSRADTNRMGREIDPATFLDEARKLLRKLKNNQNPVGAVSYEGRIIKYNLEKAFIWGDITSL